MSDWQPPCLFYVHSLLFSHGWCTTTGTSLDWSCPVPYKELIGGALNFLLPTTSPDEKIFESDSPPPVRPERTALLAAVLVLLTRLPFLLPGYGLHQDGWMLMLAGRWMSEHRWHYLCSRLPGYPFQEFIDSFLWHGGPLLVNSITALLCAAMVFFFVLILHFYRCRDALLAGLALAFVPMTYIASVMAKDYIWALTFAVAAFYFALRRRPVPAGVLLGLGVGCRVTTLGMLPFLLLLLFNPPDGDETPSDVPDSGKNVRLAITMGACTLLTSVLCFLPVYLHFGRGFFTYYPAHMPPFSILANMTVRFWGVLGLLALLIALISLTYAAGRRGPSTFARRPAKAHRRIWLALVLCYFLLFLKLPLEAAYLLPALPFFLLCLGEALPQRSFRIFCVALLIAPFLFTLRGAMAPPSPALFSARVHNYQLRLFWAGPLLDETQCRIRQRAYLDALWKFAETQKTPTVIVAVWNMPMIDLFLLTHGGALHPVPVAERPHPWCWEKSFHGEEPHGLVEFRCLLTPGQFDSLRREGKTIYCVPDMQQSFCTRLGFDPFTHGAKIVLLPCFNHD